MCLTATRPTSASDRFKAGSQAKLAAGSLAKSPNAPALHPHRACRSFSGVSSTDPSVAGLVSLRRTGHAGDWRVVHWIGPFPSFVVEVIPNIPLDESPTKDGR